MNVKIEGDQEVIDNLSKLAQMYPEAAGVAIFEEGKAIEAEAVLLVPVDTGRLRSTAYTSPPTTQNGEPTVTVSFGTNYAVYVHERTELRHPVGQAKFLETAATRAMAGYAVRVGKRIERAVESGARFGG